MPMRAPPGVLVQLLLFCQLLHALVHGDHGCNAEFHALTSWPAIPYAAGANVRGAALAIPPKCKYNRGIETR